MELIFRVNTYNSNEISSDIAYSSTFTEFGMALKNYKKELFNNNGRMIELALELKNGIIGDVYPIFNSMKAI